MGAFRDFGSVMDATVPNYCTLARSWVKRRASSWGCVRVFVCAFACVVRCASCGRLTHAHTQVHTGTHIDSLANAHTRCRADTHTHTQRNQARMAPVQTCVQLLRNYFARAAPSENGAELGCLPRCVIVSRALDESLASEGPTVRELIERLVVQGVSLALCLTWQGGELNKLRSVSFRQIVECSAVHGAEALERMPAADLAVPVPVLRGESDSVEFLAELLRFDANKQIQQQRQRHIVVSVSSLDGDDYVAADALVFAHKALELFSAVEEVISRESLRRQTGAANDSATKNPWSFRKAVPSGTALRKVRSEPLAQVVKNAVFAYAREDASVASAMQSMLEAASGAVIVVDHALQAVVGIATLSDIVLKCLGKNRDPRSTLAIDIATAPVVSLEADLPLDLAITRMLELQVRHMPITDSAQSEILGVLDLNDAVVHLLRNAESAFQALCSGQAVSIFKLSEKLGAESRDAFSPSVAAPETGFASPCSTVLKIEIRPSSLVNGHARTQFARIKVEASQMISIKWLRTQLDKRGIGLHADYEIQYIDEDDDCVCLSVDEDLELILSQSNGATVLKLFVG
ncbi:Uncharacterized protein FVE85_5184 [Porphyridium purpureum]|uniref:CBS domain-containing protein n=1 Tax=Porphyridium purpureum TaxID=35688 RepID=A0A5J4Z136_PORPP|nr:Uncharacterized protein FVE85_5184 [Porphyridium purpureum]|eukprot:POR5272..scf295_1